MSYIVGPFAGELLTTRYVRNEFPAAGVASFSWTAPRFSPFLQPSLSCP